MTTILPPSPTLALEQDTDQLILLDCMGDRSLTISELFNWLSFASS